MQQLERSSPTNHAAILGQEFGVAAADIKKLREGGVHTVETLAFAAKKDLVAIKGLSEAKVEKIQAQGEACKHVSSWWCTLYS